MTEVQVLDARRDAAGGYKVDASRGGRNGRVSSEWFSRPADERYLSPSELYGAVRGRSDRSRTRTVESTLIRVEASREAPDRLTLTLPRHGGSCGAHPMELRRNLRTSSAHRPPI